VTAPSQNALAVAIDLEWDDDFAVERAALAPVSVEVLAKPELRESQASSVVALLTAGSHVSREDMRCYPNLRVISEFGTGYDGIDLGAAREIGNAVTNVAGYCTDEVADHTLRSRSTRRGGSRRCPNRHAAAGGRTSILAR